MVCAFSSTLISLIFALLAEGAAIPKSFKPQSPQFIAIGFHVIEKPITFDPRGYSKRAGPVSLSLIDEGAAYTAQITIGSNQQPQIVQLDTGSSDLRVVDANAQCRNGDSKQGGTFDPDCSSTWQTSGEKFDMEYADETSSRGTYGADTAGIGGASITKQQFAVVSDTSSKKGVWGIGFNSLEVTTTYDNVPSSMRKQGIIAKSAY
ncbi:uncharacterized protein LODBEIA_P23160 [Lodderomyces beijingensis]|uniref:Peptidase A1 domain-containing protein n=1 Tax=Lodderomyces beijingensis TaxID=1775926 RepID=A0ABP0ZL41_9ASCO